MFSLLFIVVTIVQSKLKVIRPPSLVGELGSQIEYRLANFGKIPFGHRLMGLVDLAYPTDGCTPIINTSSSQFVLMERGGCTFVTKVRNAQSAGYQFAIIGDNVEEEFADGFAMMDDSTGYSVQIPSVLIKKKDFEILKSRAQQYQPQDMNEDKIFMLMKFDVQKQDQVNVILGLGITDGESYRLIKEFQSYYNQLKDEQINITLVYQLYSDDQLKQHNTISPNCLNSASYCAFDPDGVGIGTGKNIVEETLRQVCLFKLYPSQWFDYMKEFRTHCTLPQGYSFCGNKLFTQLQIPSDKIKSCYDDSWQTQQQENQTFTYNILLDQQLQMGGVTGLFGIPSAIINQQPLMGEITGKTLFGDICNSFVKPPKICSQEIDGGIQDQEDDQTELFLMIALVTFLIGIFAVVLYFSLKKIIHRDSRVVADQQVNEMVSNYIKFYEGRDKQKQAM